MSSGSRRAESAVEPTRSQNITVRWRRSASCRRACSAINFGLIEFGDHAQHFAAMAEQDPEPIEVLVRQFGKDTKIDPVLGKTQRVLPKPKLLEPVRNLLHWLHRLSVGGLPNFGLLQSTMLCRFFPNGTYRFELILRRFPGTEIAALRNQADMINARN